MAKIHKDLTQLEAVGLIRLVQTHPELEYLFRHALVQEVAYKSLLREDRKKLHRQVGEAMEDIYADRLEELASELGHHFGLAEDFEKAIDYLTLAGKRSARQSANQEAITYFTQALTFLEKLPDTPERAQQELTLQVALGVQLHITKGAGAPDVGLAYARARELYHQVENTSQLFPAMWGLWLFYYVRSELQTAYELAQQLWNLAQQEQEPTLLLLAHRALGTTLFFLGEFVPAWEHLEQVITHYNLQQHHAIAISYGGSDMKVHCLSFASLAMGWLGYLNQALRMSHESRALAKELSHPYSIAVASFFATWFHSSRREEAVTQELAETAINVSTEHGFPLWLTGGTALRGWALAEQGQAEEGVDQIRQGLSALRATGTEIFRPYGLILLAEAHSKAGQIAEGLTALAEALELVEKTDERYWEAEVYRLKGDLLLMQGEPGADVEANFQQAITIARQQEAKSLELRAAVSLARLWQSQGKQEEARQMLADIYGWFTEGFDTVDLKETKALLDELA